MVGYAYDVSIEFHYKGCYWVRIVSKWIVPLTILETNTPAVGIVQLFYQRCATNFTVLTKFTPLSVAPRDPCHQYRHSPLSLRLI